MASTLGDLVDDVVSTLLGYSVQQEHSTYLTGQVSDSATTLPVASVSGFGRGQVEIGDELIWVEQASGTTLTVPPYGRGFRSTAASAHGSGSRVVFRPMFPRSRVRQEINNVINMISDDVYSVATGTIEFDPAVAAYELTAASFPGLDEVLAVSWDTESATEAWLPIRRWRFTKHGNTAAFASGNVLEIMDGVRPGATVQVVYKRTPVTFDAAAVDSDPLSDTFLPETCRDLLTLGAVAAMAWGVDLGRTSVSGPGMDAVDETRQPGTTSQLARQLFAKFQQRLEVERNRVLSDVPSAVHYAR